MSIGSNTSSCSESTIQSDPNLLDRLVDNEDASSVVSDLSIPRAVGTRDGFKFYVPDVSDKNWAYGDLEHTADQTSGSVLPDHDCSSYLQQHGIILNSVVPNSPSGVETTPNFWEEHDRFDQFLKSSEFGQSPKVEDPTSPGRRLQARIIKPCSSRPLMLGLMPKSSKTAAPTSFLKRLLKRAMRVTSGGQSGS